MPAIPSKSWRLKRDGVNQCFFWNETYSVGVLVLFPVDEAKMNAVLRKLRLLGKDDFVSFQTYAKHIWNAEKRIHAIAFGEAACRARDIGTVAHEAFHCVNAMLEERGIRSSPAANDEPVAYALGWLVDAICGAMKFK